MSTFLNMRTTVDGTALLADVHAGTETLTIKSLVFGAGSWTTEQVTSVALSALVDQKLVIPVSGVVQSGGQATVNCVLVNDGLVEGFHLTELGIIAQTSGGDVLYMADYIPPEKSTWIGPDSEYRIEVPVSVVIACSSDYQVEIVINNEAPVTTADLTAHNEKPDAHQPIWAALAAKSDEGHGHAMAEISGLVAVLSAKSDEGHGHGMSEILGLVAALDAKSDDGHGHAMAEISGLVAALAAKSDEGHTHTTIDTDYISGGAMTPSVNSAAKVGTFEYGNRIYQGIAFPSGEDSWAEFEYPMPENWNRGTIKAKAFWAPSPDASGVSVGQTVSMILSGTAVGNSDILDAALAAGRGLTDAVVGVADLHVTPASSAITVGASPAVGDMIKFLVSRDVSADTLPVDMVLLGIWIQYTCNTAPVAW